MEIRCNDVPIGKLDLAGLLQDLPRLVAYKKDGMTIVLTVGDGW